MDFSLDTLTAAINHVPHISTELGDSGLFSYAGVPTLTVDVESDGYSLKLIQSRARGAAGQNIGRKTRKLRTFRIPHFPQVDEIFADEVQDVRQFGSQDQPVMLDMRLNEVLGIGAQNNDLTLEYHRFGALKGIVYDADGSVLFNFFDEFGIAQNTLDFELDSATTEVRTKCSLVRDLVAAELGGVMFGGLVAWCGADYFNAITSHKTVKETWLATARAADQTGAMPDSFDFGGITWRRSRAQVAGTPMVATTKAYVVPTGVRDLLIGRFAPANYNETVNTVGLPLYSKGIEKRNGTGWDIEMQSNFLHVNTRPRAVVEVSI